MAARACSTPGVSFFWDAASRAVASAFRWALSACPAAASRAWPSAAVGACPAAVKTTASAEQARRSCAVLGSVVGVERAGPALEHAVTPQATATAHHIAHGRDMGPF